jgi:hypothetical protein
LTKEIYVPDSIRIALPPDVTAQDAGYAIYRLRWDMEDIIKKSDDRPAEAIYKPRKLDGFAHRIDDDLLGFSYFTVTGKDREAIAEEIRKALPTISTADAKVKFEGAPNAEEKARAIKYVAITAPETKDAAALALFDKALHDESSEVRQAAILATGYAGWPELADLLRDVAENDADQEVRDDAADMLEGFGKQSRGELE